MFPGKILIIECAPVDRVSPCAIPIGYIASLYYKSINYSMEFGVLIAEFGLGRVGVVPCAESSKILCSFGCEIGE